MTIVTFGAVPNGLLGDDFRDITANGGGPNGVGTKVLPSPLASGKYMIRLTANAKDSPVYYNDPSKVRIHLIGNSQVEALLNPKGQTFVRALSIRVEQRDNIYAGDTIHQKGSGPLAQGPQPASCGIWGGSHPGWAWVVRGGGNPNQGGSYREVRFGTEVQWQGMTNEVDDEWLHSFEVCTWSPDAAKGSFGLWLARDGHPMVNVVPRTVLATCFPDPLTHYPQLSDYYERAVAGNHVVEYAAGAYAPVAETGALKAWQVEQIGYDPWGSGPPPPPPPPPVDLYQRAQDAIHDIQAANPKIAHAVQATLDYAHDKP